MVASCIQHVYARQNHMLGINDIRGIRRIRSCKQRVHARENHVLGYRFSPPSWIKDKLARDIGVENRSGSI